MLRNSLVNELKIEFHLNIQKTWLEHKIAKFISHNWNVDAFYARRIEENNLKPEQLDHQIF